MGHVSQPGYSSYKAYKTPFRRMPDIGREIPRFSRPAIIQRSRYNQFYFKSDFPYGGPIDDSTIYGRIEQFILDEFGIKDRK